MHRDDASAIIVKSLEHLLIKERDTSCCDSLNWL
jgi:hypothetical protein